MRKRQRPAAAAAATLKQWRQHIIVSCCIIYLR